MVSSLVSTARRRHWRSVITLRLGLLPRKLALRLSLSYCWRTRRRSCCFASAASHERFIMLDPKEYLMPTNSKREDKPLPSVLRKTSAFNFEFWSWNAQICASTCPVLLTSISSFSTASPTSRLSSKTNVSLLPIALN